MTIYGEGPNGERIVEYDSRWRYPHLLGFKPHEPIYADLQAMWEEATGKTIPPHEKPGLAS